MTDHTDPHPQRTFWRRSDAEAALAKAEAKLDAVLKGDEFASTVDLASEINSIREELRVTVYPEQ